MFSGGDSTESPKCTQWAMNPAAYQNAANDQVDWAALAQQWIIMKEAGPPPIPGGPEVTQRKTTAPGPILTLFNSAKPEKAKPRVGPLLPEGGEAEMEMETEREEPPAWNPACPENPPPGPDSWATWNQPPGQSWNWTSSWNSPTAVPPPHVVKTPLLPTPNRMFPTPSDAGSDNAVPYGGYNSSSQSSNNEFSNQPAFWTNMSVGKITQTEIKPHNKRYSKVNVPTKVTIITPAVGAEPHMPPPTVAAEVPVVSAPPVPVLDAHRRKQLPAWIREGLEKMERDKLKQMEKEKEKVARAEYTEKVKLEEKEAMEILKNTIKEKNLLRKSRFDSDHEQSDDEPVKRRKVSPPPPVPLTQEELMIKVRKTMTEILLKVTNQLIEQTCKEERQRYIKKRRASDQLASAPSGAAIKAKLGLGVYEEGSSSSDGSESEDRREESSDSEIELKESIKKRQAAFSRTEQEIKDRLADVERKKGRDRSPSHSTRSSSADSRDIDSQVEANVEVKDSNAKEEANSSGSSDYGKSKSKRRSSSSSRGSTRSRSAGRSRKSTRYSPKKRSRSLSKGSRRDRSVESYRRDSIESKKKNRRSRSGSRYSKRSKKSRSRSRSYSSRKSSKTTRYTSRRTRTRSRSRDRKHRSHKSSSSRSHDSRSKRSRRSRSRSYKQSPSRSKRRSSRSSSRGRRSHRR